jgi:predicted transcriptional regulator
MTYPHAMLRAVSGFHVPCSFEDGWQARIAAWEAECDRVKREEFFDSTADCGRAQAEAGRSQGGAA